MSALRLEVRVLDMACVVYVLGRLRMLGAYHVHVLHMVWHGLCMWMVFSVWVTHDVVMMRMRVWRVLNVCVCVWVCVCVCVGGCVCVCVCVGVCGNCRNGTLPAKKARFEEHDSARDVHQFILRHALPESSTARVDVAFLIEKFGSASICSGSVIDSYRILSNASEDFEINSRRKISLLE